MSKPAEAFSKDRTRPDGLNAECKLCDSEKMKLRRQKDPAGVRAIAKKSYDKTRAKRVARKSQYYRENRATVNAQVESWRKRHPAARKAYRLVKRALDEGALARPDRCSSCNAAGMIEAHHEDYDKPLEVEWLCRYCHKQRHGEA